MRIPQSKRRPPEGWWTLETILGIVVALIVIGTVFMATDCFGGNWGPPVAATVIQRVYQPSHSSTGVGTAVGSNGQVGTVVVSSSEPEEWKLIVSSEGQTFSVSCDGNQWGRSPEGESIQIQQKLGLITGGGWGWRVAR